MLLGCVFILGRGMQPISAYDSRTKVQLMIHCGGNCSLLPHTQNTHSTHSTHVEWIAVAATNDESSLFQFRVRFVVEKCCKTVTGRGAESPGKLVYEMKAKIRPTRGSGWMGWGKPFGWRQIAFCIGKTPVTDATLMQVEKIV